MTARAVLRDRRFQVVTVVIAGTCWLLLGLALAPRVIESAGYAWTVGVGRAHQDAERGLVSAPDPALTVPATESAVSPLSTHSVNGFAWSPGGAR